MRRRSSSTIPKSNRISLNSWRFKEGSSRLRPMNRMSLREISKKGLLLATTMEVKWAIRSLPAIRMLPVALSTLEFSLIDHKIKPWFLSLEIFNREAIQDLCVELQVSLTPRWANLWNYSRKKMTSKLLLDSSGTAVYQILQDTVFGQCL